MKIEIKHRFSGSVLFSCEADSMKSAVKLAIEAKADLSGADLSGANLDYTNIPMWCVTLKGVKVDFRLVCQMLLHVFALECEDKRFLTVKKVIGKFAKLSDKWSYYAEKHGLPDTTKGGE